VSYREEKQPAKALARVREAAAGRLNSAAVQRYCAGELFHAGDLEAAAAALSNAKAADPKQWDIDLDFARIDIKRGNIAAAHQKLSALETTRGGDERVLYMIAMLEEVQGNNSRAIDYYRRIVDIDDHNVTALNNLAAHLSEQPDQLDTALKFAQRAKELAPNGDAAIDDTIGWIYYRKGLYHTAVKYLETAVKAGGGAKRKYHLAMAYAANGQQQPARQTFEIAQQLDASLPEAREARETLQRVRP
jgi:tetratricopeptide (TPR) repeat protein